MKKRTITPTALILASLSSSVSATEPFDMNTIHSKFENEMHSNSTTKKAEFEQYVLNALIVNDSSRWNYDSPLGTAVTVRYAFAGESFGYPCPVANCVHRDFQTYEKDVFVNVLNDISKVAGITFEEVNDASDTNIIFTISTAGSGAEFPPTNAGDATRPRLVSISDASTLFYLNPARNVQPYDRPNHYDIDFKHDVARSWSTIIHEMGHALGLKHPFYQDANGDWQNHLDASEANKLFTVMEYNMPQTSSEMYHPTTFKKYDIVTLQHLYGAPATPEENDYYEYDDTFSYHQIIVDTDGHDTLSVVNSTRNNVLDLRSGAFSSIAPNPTGFYDADSGDEHMNRSHNSLAIGFGTVIEDATGGSGDDTLVGNEVNNKLEGGLGLDRAIYPGNKDDYSITKDDNFVTVTSLSSGDIDTLKSIEIIEFKDQIFTLNNAPILTMPEDIIVRVGSSVELSVTASDPDNDDLIYSWVQTSGTSVTLSGSDSATVSFTAPIVNTVSTVVLEANVSDSVDTTKDVVNITIQPNNAPELTITDPQTVNEGDSVTISVTATDDDNDALSYRWVQVNGTTLNLTGSDTDAVTFVAPNVTADETLSVEVFVSDSFDEVSKTTTVTIKNVETSTTTSPDTKSPENKSSGGTFGWVLLLAGGLLTARRKIAK